MVISTTAILILLIVLFIFLPNSRGVNGWSRADLTPVYVVFVLALLFIYYFELR